MPDLPRLFAPECATGKKKAIDFSKNPLLFVELAIGFEPTTG
jgi:hypothetical protein